MKLVIVKTLEQVRIYLQSMYGTLIAPPFLDPPNTSDTADEGNSTYVTGISNKIFMNIYLKPIARSSKHYS